MLFKYALKSFRSRFGEAIVAAVTVVLCLLLMLLLNNIITDLQAELDDTYEYSEIACVVSDATGDVQTGLAIPSDYLDFFARGGSLHDDVTDLSCHIAASFLLLGEERIPFHLINTPDAVMMFEETAITYFDGCGPEMFAGTEAVGVIAESLMPHVAQDGTLTLLFPPRGEDFYTFRVIGTCVLDQAAIYVSLDSGRELMERNERTYTLDSLSFIIADNRRLNESKMALSDYFIPAARSNQGSSRFGLLMDDAAFVDAVTVLERSLALFQLFRTVLFLLSAGVCFLVTFLLIRRRRAELAVMRSLGCRTRLIYGQMLCEQVMFFAVGTSLTVALTAVLGLSPGDNLVQPMAGLLVCWLLSAVISIVTVTSGDIMKILKGKE